MIQECQTVTISTGHTITDYMTDQHMMVLTYNTSLPNGVNQHFITLSIHNKGSNLVGHLKEMLWSKCKYVLNFDWSNSETCLKMTSSLNVILYYSCITIPYKCMRCVMCIGDLLHDSKCYDNDY